MVYFTLTRIIETLAIGFICLFSFKQALATEPILPIPAPSGLHNEKVALGKLLFYEKKLSADGQVSCATCHVLELGGMDGLQFSEGVFGRKTELNTPTIFNSALSFRQFWDGRAASLEEQLGGPIGGPKEMGSSWQQVTTFLQQNTVYKKGFQEIYRKGVTEANVRDAMAEFERSLTLSGSRFDQYLSGNEDAITAGEKKGYALFKSYGCVACHQGAAVGGNMFQKLGVMQNYFSHEKGDIHSHDEGRFKVTGKPEDKYVFKVPSLRMVSLTAPYLHDGSVPTLAGMIRLMGKYQLGQMIPDDDIMFIEQFLHTLPGLYEGEAW
ncbi:MAG: cytochrome c peroxidase [Ghiorsea sp.]|nr:cytochrome c peroxidase [Ghiorsea sp.]